mmetsp:Transcript_31347/g.47614  ORF Transcript_31347/g.47614 Transcript_31347/m.47614 type:complete len:105 (+) Transcript_31347:1286-1600(+)
MRLTYCVIQRVIFFVGTIRLVGDNDISYILSLYPIYLSFGRSTSLELGVEWLLGIFFPMERSQKGKNTFFNRKKCGIQLLNSSNLVVLQTVPSTIFISSMVHHL